MAEHGRVRQEERCAEKIRNGSDVQLCSAREAGAGGSSAAGDPGDGGHDSEGDVAALCEAVFRGGAAVDRAGTVVAGAAAADFLFRAERAATGGAVAVQPAVPLVCGHGHGRRGVEPRGVLEEPGAVAERRSGGGFLPAGAAAGATVLVG